MILLKRFVRLLNFSLHKKMQTLYAISNFALKLVELKNTKKLIRVDRSERINIVKGNAEAPRGQLREK